MFRTLLIAFILVSQTVSAQLAVNVRMLNRTAPNRSDTIYYNPAKKLTWDKFKGKPVQGDYAAAVTTSGFGYKAAIEYDDEGGELNITVFCYFSKKASWVKPGRKTASILNHEQRHFDITYLWTREFQNKLGQAQFTPDNFSSEISRIYQEAYTAMNKMQDDYDADTGNGQAPQKQTEWDNYLRDRIANL